MKSRSAFINSFIEVYGDNTESLAARLNVPAQQLIAQAKQMLAQFPALAWIQHKGK